ILGSIERFFGILIEHFAGKFPVWLAPVQVVIIPVADAHHDFANGIEAQLTAIGVRASVDDRGEKLGYRIREAQMQKIPYMLVIGDKEAEGGDLALRIRDTGDAGLISLSDLKEKLIEKIKTKSLTLD
ncbi:MAG: His/Gly/Thr/Pro-type tRNA ligase C-terminal domain-containing protein, partial [Acetobacterium sp.]|nr:His/Gly/Thr/Pro-type tRNA ligase C-terminal domain-containing protein [Acetobacterium sp.]